MRTKETMRATLSVGDEVVLTWRGRCGSPALAHAIKKLTRQMDRPTPAAVKPSKRRGR